MNRFPRVLGVRTGYEPDQVDALIQRIEATLGRGVLEGDPVTADEIRTSRFNTKLGGYNELAVDYALDAFVIAVEIHAQQTSEPPRRDHQVFEPPRRDQQAFEPPKADHQVFEPPRADQQVFEPPRASSVVEPPGMPPVPESRGTASVMEAPGASVFQPSETPAASEFARGPSVFEPSGTPSVAEPPKRASGFEPSVEGAVPASPEAAPAVESLEAAPAVEPPKEVSLFEPVQPASAFFTPQAAPVAEAPQDTAEPPEEEEEEEDDAPTLPGMVKVTQAAAPASREPEHEGDPQEDAGDQQPVTVTRALTTAWLEEQAARVERVLFRPGRLGAGYNEDEVDIFLDRVVATLRGTTDHPLTADQVRTAQFSTVVFKSGYAVTQVDAFLAEIAEVLERRDALIGEQEQPV
ncbi:DivIVA domain-containing protein [Sphaerisporangium perillae]|uniref:DivIVA domain-containing protein n=1 Tax=Sphaerisporangium perillae TaxID=2935860 RepID=UPI00200C097E|nr:DivIVA domain-containing protein [Sphaerisporangium perillae]